MRKHSVCLIGALALMISGCANSGVGGLGGGETAAGKPKTIVVSELVFEDNVGAVDRGYTTRLGRRAGGEVPTGERKDRTIARVNDEIVATIVATLRQNGLDAQPGAAEGLGAGERAVVVAGILRAADVNPKRDSVGFGPGRGGVAADITLTDMGGGARKQLLAFTVEAGKGRVVLSPATNAAINGLTAAGGPTGEKLSSDVEGPARALGRNAGDRIVAYAREQGWAAEAPPVAEKPARPAPRSTRRAAPAMAPNAIVAPEPEAEAEPKN